MRNEGFAVLPLSSASMKARPVGLWGGTPTVCNVAGVKPERVHASPERERGSQPENKGTRCGAVRAWESGLGERACRGRALSASPAPDRGSQPDCPALSRTAE